MAISLCEAFLFRSFSSSVILLLRSSYFFSLRHSSVIFFLRPSERGPPRVFQLGSFFSHPERRLLELRDLGSFCFESLVNGRREKAGGPSTRATLAQDDNRREDRRRRLSHRFAMKRRRRLRAEERAKSFDCARRTRFAQDDPRSEH